MGRGQTDEILQFGWDLTGGIHNSPRAIELPGRSFSLKKTTLSACLSGWLYSDSEST